MNGKHPLESEHFTLTPRDKLFLDLTLAAENLGSKLLDGSVSVDDLAPGTVLPEETTYGASVVTVEFVGENEVGLSAQFKESSRLTFDSWSEMKELLDARAYELRDQVQLEHLVYEADPYGRYNWWGNGSAYQQEREEEQAAEAFERRQEEQ